eukprot:symbB.v1.2.007564.t1/scaffold461.1/size201717/5
MEECKVCFGNGIWPLNVSPPANGSSCGRQPCRGPPRSSSLPEILLMPSPRAFKALFNGPELPQRTFLRRMLPKGPAKCWPIPITSMAWRCSPG